MTTSRFLTESVFGKTAIIPKYSRKVDRATLSVKKESASETDIRYSRFSIRKIFRFVCPFHLEFLTGSEVRTVAARVLEKELLREVLISVT